VQADVSNRQNSAVVQICRKRFGFLERLAGKETRTYTQHIGDIYLKIYVTAASRTENGDGVVFDKGNSQFPLFG
jgi:hypothetical protein